MRNINRKKTSNIFIYIYIYTLLFFLLCMCSIHNNVLNTSKYSVLETYLFRVYFIINVIEMFSLQSFNQIGWKIEWIEVYIEFDRNVRNLMNALINNIVKDTFIIEILLLKEEKTKGRKFYCDNCKHICIQFL